MTSIYISKQWKIHSIRTWVITIGECGQNFLHRHPIDTYIMNKTKLFCHNNILCFFAGKENLVLIALEQEKAKARRTKTITVKEMTSV